MAVRREATVKNTCEKRVHWKSIQMHPNAVVYTADQYRAKNIC
jgi:hypothetical protein